ncbi:MAG: hypothetical protein MHM6MM_002853 [Cercozoa sp. M6MM]
MSRLEFLRHLNKPCNEFEFSVRFFETRNLRFVEELQPHEGVYVELSRKKKHFLSRVGELTAAYAIETSSRHSRNRSGSNNRGHDVRFSGSLDFVSHLYWESAPVSGQRTPRSFQPKVFEVRVWIGPVDDRGHPLLDVESYRQKRRAMWTVRKRRGSFGDLTSESVAFEKNEKNKGDPTGHTDDNNDNNDTDNDNDDEAKCDTNDDFRMYENIAAEEDAELAALQCRRRRLYATATIDLKDKITPRKCRDGKKDVRFQYTRWLPLRLVGDKSKALVELESKAPALRVCVRAHFLSSSLQQRALKRQQQKEQLELPSKAQNPWGDDAVLRHSRSPSLSSTISDSLAVIPESEYLSTDDSEFSPEKPVSTRARSTSWVSRLKTRLRSRSRECVTPPPERTMPEIPVRPRATSFNAKRESVSRDAEFGLDEHEINSLRKRAQELPVFHAMRAQQVLLRHRSSSHNTSDPTDCVGDPEVNDSSLSLSVELPLDLDADFELGSSSCDSNTERVRARSGTL